MASLLTNLRNTIIAGFVLAFVVLIIFVMVGQYDVAATLQGTLFWAFVFRWLHVLSGILWIGLLYYFNFVQIPTMPKIPDEQKPAVSKFIAPEVGAITLGASDSFAAPSTTLIGIGMWLGSIMWFNVWFVIWPNQQKALNIDNKFPDLSKDQRAAHGRTAMLFSRTNFLLSVPMLFAMVGAQNLG